LSRAALCELCSTPCGSNRRPPRGTASKAHVNSAHHRRRGGDGAQPGREGTRVEVAFSVPFLPSRRYGCRLVPSHLPPAS
jgi:hypothetical protein